MMRPTRVEPVKLTRRTAGWAIMASTTAAASSGALVMTLTTPAGSRPRQASTISWCVRGQFSEPLRTTVLPQASGVAMARTPRMTGAFHGAMPSTTPAGWRTAMASEPGLSEGITSPAICVVRGRGLAQHAGGQAPDRSETMSRKQALPTRRPGWRHRHRRRSTTDDLSVSGWRRSKTPSAASCGLFVHDQAACLHRIRPLSTLTNVGCACTLREM